MADRRPDPDSRARTHLANERTFLAWLRTGLSLVALGLAAAQFLEADLIPGVPVTTIFSLFLVATGIGLTVIGGVHYTHAREAIEHGTFLPSTRVAVLAAAFVTIAGAVAFVLVLLMQVRD